MQCDLVPQHHTVWGSKETVDSGPTFLGLLWRNIWFCVHTATLNGLLCQIWSVSVWYVHTQRVLQRIWVSGAQPLKVTQGHASNAVWMSTYDCLLVIHSNYMVLSFTISEKCWDTGPESHISQIHLYIMPPLRVIPPEFCNIVKMFPTVHCTAILTEDQREFP